MVWKWREPASRPRKAARYVGATFVGCGSLALAVAAFHFAPDHLDSIGFAAGNREPNRFLYKVHYGVGFAAVGNVVLILVGHVLLAGILLVPLTVASVVLYLATW